MRVPHARIVFLSVLLLTIAAGCFDTAPKTAPPSAPSEPPPGKRLVIVDDDNGMAIWHVIKYGNYERPIARFADPDGGLEILYVLRDPSVHLLGLTCLMGCLDLEGCMEADRNLLRAAGREDVPVYPGASSPHDMGKETPAARFIVDTVNRYPSRVEIVASGPMTNIATALIMDPSLPSKWKALYVLSGEFGRGSNIERAGHLTGGDLNLSVDFPAAAFVFSHAGPLEVFPNSLMDDVLITSQDLKILRRAGTPIARHVFGEVRLWNRVVSLYFRQDGFWPHGMTGAAAALHPEHRGTPTRSAIRVKPAGEPVRKHYWGPIVTEMVDDPDLPVHEIYFHFENEEKFRRDYLARLR